MSRQTSTTSLLDFLQRAPVIPATTDQSLATILDSPRSSVSGSSTPADAANLCSQPAHLSGLAEENITSESLSMGVVSAHNSGDRDKGLTRGLSEGDRGNAQASSHDTLVTEFSPGLTGASCPESVSQHETGVADQSDTEYSSGHCVSSPTFSKQLDNSAAKDNGENVAISHHHQSARSAPSGASVTEAQTTNTALHR